jgi:hypothetical protein
MIGMDTRQPTRSVTASSDIRPHDLPAAVAEHRTDYWTWVDNHADKRLRADLLELRDHWRDCNERFFDGRMHLPYITLTEPSNPRRDAQCCPESSWGSRLEIRLRQSLLVGTHPMMLTRRAGRVGRMQFVKDVLLHEMIHQHIMEHQPTVNEDSYRGHGPVFTAHCNRIGAQLGLPKVIVRNRKGKPPQPTSASWPHCVAPPDRYLGAYEPHPTVTASADTEITPARLRTALIMVCEMAERVHPDTALACEDDWCAVLVARDRLDDRLNKITSHWPLP